MFNLTLVQIFKGLFYVRGCEVEGMLDENGRVIEEFSGEPKPKFKTNDRTFRVKLDCNQYREDMDLTSKGAEDVYASFNILMRRKPKENNFKVSLDFKMIFKSIFIIYISYFCFEKKNSFFF